MAVGVLAHSGSYGRVHDLDRSRRLMVRETSPVVLGYVPTVRHH